MYDFTMVYSGADYKNLSCMSWFCFPTCYSYKQKNTFIFIYKTQKMDLERPMYFVALRLFQQKPLDGDGLEDTQEASGTDGHTLANSPKI